MAGHSAWANIQHRKGRQDAKKGKIATRLIREITVAAKMGGSSIDGNPRLRLAVDKGYGANITKDTIERAIKRGAGETDGADYQEVRHAFSKNGGNMGTDGSVAFLFKHCGTLLFAPGTKEDSLMEAALDAGADDVVTNEDGSIEVITGPYDFVSVKEALVKAGFASEHGEVTMKPSTPVEFDGEDAVKMQKLLDALENLDDVQNVYTSAVINE
jgi:transcriptional/translational regulatory protein YebC/TACO1